ncbi:MAG TPA: c-type cytochrome [Bryobacteraceae bacterium]|nr:c-type cytochrome [Bryobacteraceae bacterium]
MRSIPVALIQTAILIAAAFAQTEDKPAGDPALGQRLFESQCAVCHGQTGAGGRGPNLHHPKLKHAPDDAALRKVISDGIQPEMPGAWQLNPREVASVAAFVTTLGSIPVEPIPGDPQRGERVYRAKGCTGCHTIAGDGSGFGPELTDIGSRRSAAHLRESLVTPEASVPDGFLLVELVTPAGATIRGIRLNEDTFSIQIKDSKSAFHSFRKSELKEIRKLRGKSPMPSYESLTAGELTDLIAYLASLRGKS